MLSLRERLALDFRGATGSSCHHGAAGGERFEMRKAQAFPRADGDQRIGCEQKRRDIWIGRIKKRRDKET